MIDWSRCSALESVPGKVSGAWVFRGTRVPVSVILKNFKHLTLDQLVENYPSVRRDQIEAVLDFLARESDLYDRFVAEARLEKRLPSLTSQEVRKELDLEH